MANTALLTAVQATDTQDLLDHIAWTEVVEPRLLELKEQYSIMLVNHELGSPLPPGVLREQLAGRIYGINFIRRIFADILKRGEAAINDLKAEGFSLNIT